MKLVEQIGSGIRGIHDTCLEHGTAEPVIQVSTDWMTVTFPQAHRPIRAALDDYSWPTDIKYEVFLQGSYKNDTNLGGDSDVDVAVRLNQRLRPRVVELSGRQLQDNASHLVAYRRWKSFRDHALKAIKARFGSAANERQEDREGAEGQDPRRMPTWVVALRFRDGVAFYKSDAGR